MAQSKDELDSRKVWYWTGGIMIAAIVVIAVMWAMGVMGPTPTQ